MGFIDLRSDTVTQPTDKMREAMFNAQVGDDVYGDDPTINELEAYAAELTGKEAAMFVPSGTFGNQVCIMTHCRRGDEVLLGENCHIMIHEVGAAAALSGVQLRTLKDKDGEFIISELQEKLRGEDIHFPDTGLICMESAHSTGKVPSLLNIKAVHDIAKEHNIPMHLDGARLFNAAEYLNVDVKEISKYFDTITFCLSKGLCAPVGSIVVGSKDFIVRAKKNRKRMGGGLRQAGFLAAAGLVALKEMRGHLKEDHKNAKLLGELLSQIPGVKVNLEDIHINMVFFDMKETGVNSDDIVRFFYDKLVKISSDENGIMRFVTNYWVTEKDIYYVFETFKEAVKALKEE
ncbi:low-specificity L-threonine aldolase [Clostridium polynesiense]|uniref:low-specificity L-threonine aldolase n=1 Tax=Clostridium polynesiense TaxID=1325933 RepID=UPI0005907934|nr:low-specificity L-threonine aldolase [Clostridium polynesiense]